MVDSASDLSDVEGARPPSRVRRCRKILCSTKFVVSVSTLFVICLWRDFEVVRAVRQRGLSLRAARRWKTR
jgi:hypothetical protein